MVSPLYYLLTFLPPLPAMGEALPISFDDLQVCVDREQRPEVSRLIEAIRLEERIEAFILKRFREAASSQAETAKPSELFPFPPEIAAVLSVDAAEIGEDHWLSAIWREYYRWLGQVGRSGGSVLLAEWALFESELREELAAFRMARSTRSDAGGKDSLGAGSAMVADGPRFASLIGSWARATDPFAGERLLDQARWTFLEERCGVFSFSIDECVGYVLRLRLLNRYQRLNRVRGEQILREVAGL